MNNRLQVQLNMVGACITVAQSSDYKPAWNGQTPADFGTDILQLATDYGAVTAKAAQADGATGGAAVGPCGSHPKPWPKPHSKMPRLFSPARSPFTSRNPATSTVTARWT
jgi:hypothetical protein